MNTLLPSKLVPEFLRAIMRTGGGSFAHRLEAASFLLQRKDLGTLGSLMWETFFGAADMLVLRLDLESFRSEHLRRFSLAVRPVEPRDEADFFNPEAPGLTGQGRRDAVARLFMLRAGIQTCYVVEESSGKACFLQWLIPFSENDKLHQVYGRWYPDLHPGEAMIEHAYMLPKYRGCGILPCATAQVLECAREAGVRRIVTIIPTWNINSLNSFMRLGFAPEVHRSDRKFFGIRWRQMQRCPLGADARIPDGLRLNLSRLPNRPAMQQFQHSPA